MALRVDPDGKVTVSLGGICTLKCRHCYTLTSSFQHAEPISIEGALSAIKSVERVKVICLSGDTDLFIEPDVGADFLSAVADANILTTIMFTTRLVPPITVRTQVAATLRRARERRQFIIPCISVVTLQFPNGVEHSELVPSGRYRIDWLNEIANTGHPALLTLRPTFPFAIVGKTEIDEIAAHASPRVAAALGEVFLLDPRGQIEKKIGLDLSSHIRRRDQMTFLDQTSEWRKAYLDQEVEYHRHVYRDRGTPYFLRSMTAVELIEAKWSFDAGFYEGLVDADFREERDIYP